MADSTLTTAPPASPNPYQSPSLEPQAVDERPTNRTADRIALWCGALLFGGITTVANLSLFTRGPAGIVWGISNVSGAVLLGLGLVLIVCIAIRREFRMMHPGHWFAIATLPAFVGNLLSMPWSGQPFFMIGGEAYYSSGLVSRFSEAIVRVVLFVAIARFCKVNRPWKIYAWGYAIIAIAQFLHLLLSVLFSMTYAEPIYWLMVVIAQGANLAVFAGGILLIASIVNDVRSGIRRDKLHWVAIILGVTYPVTSYLWQALSFSFPMRDYMNP